MPHLEHEHGLLLQHMVHVSERWTIVQGTDGLSRAHHLQGVMKGLGMSGLHAPALTSSGKGTKFIGDRGG
jgi:hypothetical protein